MPLVNTGFDEDAGWAEDSLPFVDAFEFLRLARGGRFFRFFFLVLGFFLAGIFLPALFHFPVAPEVIKVDFDIVGLLFSFKIFLIDVQLVKYVPPPSDGREFTVFSCYRVCGFAEGD